MLITIFSLLLASYVSCGKKLILLYPTYQAKKPKQHQCIPQKLDRAKEVTISYPWMFLATTETTQMEVPHQHVRKQTIKMGILSEATFILPIASFGPYNKLLAESTISLLDLDASVDRSEASKSQGNGVGENNCKRALSMTSLRGYTD